MKVNEILKNLKNQIDSNISKIEVLFTGSGDSFESFYDFSYFDEKNAYMHSNKFKEPDVSIFNDLLYYMLDNSDTNFNDDGCNGVITIDFKENTVGIDVKHIVKEEVSGEGLYLTEVDDIEL